MKNITPLILIGILILFSGCASNESKRKYKQILSVAKMKSATPRQQYDGSKAAMRGYLVDMEANRYKGQNGPLAAKLLQASSKRGYPDAVESIYYCSLMKSAPKNYCLSTALKSVRKPDAIKARNALDFLAALKQGFYGGFGDGGWSRNPYSGAKYFSLYDSKEFKAKRSNQKLVSFKEDCKQRVRGAYGKKFPLSSGPNGMVDLNQKKSLVLYPEIKIEDYRKIFNDLDKFNDFGKASKRSLAILRRLEALSECSKNIELLGADNYWLALKENMIRFVIKRPIHKFNYANLYSGLAFVEAQRGNTAESKSWMSKSIEADSFYKKMRPIWDEEVAQYMAGGIHARLEAKREAIRRVETEKRVRKKYKIGKHVF